MAASALAEQIATLQSYVDDDTLSMGDQRFALSLISKSGNPKFSASQREWVGKLIDRAETPQQPNERIGNMSDLYDFFLNARKHLKFPKLTVRLPDDTAVKLYMSGDRSKSPDTINVVLPDVYQDNGRNVWLGRIHKDGRWEQPYRKHETLPLVRDLLEALQQDAHGIAAAYGKKTGNCCFCLKTLSDNRSVAVGYGKTCASHYGLSEYWKNA